MKLSLRDLFWLVLVVGMGIGWWVDRQKLAERISRLENKKDHFLVAPGQMNNISEVFEGHWPAWLGPKPVPTDDRSK